jgi:hypothetical protein
MGRVQARAVASTNREEAPAAHGRPRLSRIVLATAAGLGLLAGAAAISASATQAAAAGPRAVSTASRIPARATTRYAGPPAIRTRTWHARLARADNHPGRHGRSVRFIPLTEKIRPVIGGGIYACSVSADFQ